MTRSLPLLARQPRSGLTVGLLALIVAFAVQAVRPSTASAEELALNATQAAACPSCVTDHGGARVVGLMASIAGAAGKQVTYSGPVSGFDYAADASRIYSNYAGLNAGGGSLTSTADVAKRRVVGEVFQVASRSVAFPNIAAGVVELPIATTLAAGIASFAVGYGIGSAGKWLVGKLFTGGPMPSSTWSTPRWWMVPAGGALWGDGITLAELPERYSTGAFQFRMHGGSNTSWQEVSGWCDGMGGAFYSIFINYQPVGGTAHHVTSTSTCGASSTGRTAYFATPGDLMREAPTTSTTLPSGYANLGNGGPMPARPSVAQAVADGLNAQTSTELARWLEHQLNPRCNPDPTLATVIIPTPLENETGTDYAACLETLGLQATTETLPESDLDEDNGAPALIEPEPGTEVDPETVPVALGVNAPARTFSREDNRCLPSGAGTPGDPGAPTPDGSPYPQFQAPPFPVLGSYPATDPRTTPHPSITVYLRWGTTRWGWRHVKIRRGYSVVDEQETAGALASDPLPTRRHSSTQQYVFHRYFFVPDGTGGMLHCVRNVAVDFATWNDFAAKHIITSNVGALIDQG